MTKINALKLGSSLEAFHEFDRAYCDGQAFCPSLYSSQTYILKVEFVYMLSALTGPSVKLGFFNFLSLSLTEGPVQGRQNVNKLNF